MQPLLVLYAVFESHIETDKAVCIRIVASRLDTTWRQLSEFRKFSGKLKSFPPLHLKFLCGYPTNIKCWFSYELEDKRYTKIGCLPL